jgi:hypothetical protein
VTIRQLSPRRRWLTALAVVAVVIGFLNFLWFFAESSTIGDANRGYTRDGRYFLVHAGRATEVSREAYEWSTLHGASLFVSHPLAMAGGAYLLFTVWFPSMVGAGRNPDDRLRVDRIRGSGNVLAGARTGGRLGELRLTRPLIGVEVRPGGVVLSPFGMDPIGIEADSILGVVREQSKLTGSGMAISHRQVGAPRVRLLLDEGDPVVIATRSIALSQADGPLDRSPAPQPAARSTEPYSGTMKAMIVVGFVLSIVFAAVAIPFGSQLGSFGQIWAILLIAIIGFNGWTYFIRNRDRW